MGLGPPAGLRLRSGRLLVPSYHTTLLAPTVDNGLLSKGHALLSDDDGATWRISEEHDYGHTFWPNECQAAQLPNGSVVSVARGLTHRLITRSDDEGEHWGATRAIPSLPEPISGVEGASRDSTAARALLLSSSPPHRPSRAGSTLGCPNSSRLIFGAPTHPRIVRAALTIYTSDDSGLSWAARTVVDPAASDYSSLAWSGDRLALLYGRSDETRTVFEPDNISFVLLPDPC